MATDDCEKVNERYISIYQIKSKTVWNIQLEDVRNWKTSSMRLNISWGLVSLSWRGITGGNIFFAMQKAFAIKSWHLECLPVCADFQNNTNEGQSHRHCYCYSYLVMCTELLYGISTQGHSWNWNSSFSSMTQNIQNNNHSCHQLSPNYAWRVSNILNVATDL